MFCCLWFLIRPGDVLLSRALRRSTIGAEGFHGRVRNGIGCIAPRYDHQAEPGTIPLGYASCVGTLGPAYRFVTLVSAVFGKSCWRVLYRASAGDLISGTCRCGGGWSCSRLPEGSWESVKPIERLVPVSFTCCHASTPGLSTWWSSTALRRDLVSRGAPRLDAFSGYPFRT